jgi:hypothetical protein
MTGIFRIENEIGILLPKGVPETGTKNWNSQPSICLGVWCHGVNIDIYKRTNILYQSLAYMRSFEVDPSLISARTFPYKCTSSYRIKIAWPEIVSKYIGLSIVRSTG